MLSTQGFITHSATLDPTEIIRLIKMIEANRANRGFGIRYFLSRNPEVKSLLAGSPGFKKLLARYFIHPVVIKSIYFDKPPAANWAVPWHQDITVNLTAKNDHPDFINWRELPERVVAQPPTELLKRITTFRIHLDVADAGNGALKVIPASHTNGVIRMDGDYVSENLQNAVLCPADTGDTLVLKPLTLHASQRVIDDNRRRRVIHLEVLEASHLNYLPWKEKYPFPISTHGRK